MNREKPEGTPRGACLGPKSHFYQEISYHTGPYIYMDDTYGSSHVPATAEFCHRRADAYLTANREMPLIGAVPRAMPIGV
jgi:hypothetical protein